MLYNKSMRRTEDNILVGRQSDVIRYYFKTRGIKLLPTSIRFWREKGLLEGCIYKWSKGHRVFYDVVKTALRIDTIYAFRKYNRLTIAEIRTEIQNRLNKEDYERIQKNGY